MDPVGCRIAGSVRVPASYCGILGMRPSHGRASLEGACPLGPSFDTCEFLEICKPVKRA